MWICIDHTDFNSDSDEWLWYMFLNTETGQTRQCFGPYEHYQQILNNEYNN